MPRPPLAAAAILVVVISWIVGSVILADHLGPLHWALRAVYFALAGFAWVFPVRWLMLWGAGQR